MGGKALRAKPADISQSPCGIGVENNRQAVVAQLFEKKLKIGISGNQTPIGISADLITKGTFVWILTNAKKEKGDLFGEENKSKMVKTTPTDIIDKNQTRVNAPIYAKQRGTKSGVSRGIFQSGIFYVPREGGAKAEGIDYSFLRFAALGAYQNWYKANGKQLGWPDALSGETLLETIDSDVSGITGDSSDELSVTSGADWLVEAGVYRWDWNEIKDFEGVNSLFVEGEEGVVDTNKRDATLKDFSDIYTQGEIEKRSVAASNIYNIYFPEPATRLSSDAVKLLGDAKLGEMEIIVGGALGKGRESIGLIAALVHLDGKGDRSKKKLKFNPKFIVTTGLGIRKNAYASIFIGWYKAVISGKNKESVKVVEEVVGVKDFDQSYYKPGLPSQISKWHESTLSKMDKSKTGPGKSFFNPDS